MKQHKWAKEIKAWADGAEIQAKHCNADNWHTDDEPYFWQDDFEFRIKPQPKEPQYLYVYMNRTIDPNNYVLRTSKHEDGIYIGKIKLEDE